MENLYIVYPELKNIGVFLCFVYLTILFILSGDLNWKTFRILINVRWICNLMPISITSGLFNEVSCFGPAGNDEFNYLFVSSY